MSVVVPVFEQDPRTVGRYSLLGRLASGAGGGVRAGTRYLASTPNGQTVVVTAFGGALAADPEFRERVRAEAQAARRVAPFATAAVVDADADAPSPYLVTEFVEGPTLAETVRDNGPMTGTDLERLAATVANALTALHIAGVFHRDLHPGNVVVTPAGARVVDVGAAVSRHAGVLTGETAFRAPEQLLGEVSTPAADVYAWGGVVLFAATGRRPHGGGEPAELVHRVLHETADLAGLDAGLAPLVSRALDRDPARRPAAQELLMTLVASQAASPAPRQQPHLWCLRVAILALFVTLLVVTVACFVR
jgi:serine/threonine protein kinase